MSSDRTQHINVIAGALCEKVCMQNARARNKHPFMYQGGHVQCRHKM